MDGKKDPGKFTVRFNLCDPQQRQAAELLNQQGRSKAQFIANAILSYAGGSLPAPQAVPTMDDEQLRKLVEDILTQHQDSLQQEWLTAPEGKNLTGSGELDDIERSSIFQTLNAFQRQ